MRIAHLPIYHFPQRLRASMAALAMALVLTLPAGFGLAAVSGAAAPTPASANSTCWGAYGLHNYYLHRKGRADSDLQLDVFKSSYGVVAKVESYQGRAHKLHVEIQKQSGQDWYTQQDSLTRYGATWVGCVRGTGFGHYRIIGYAVVAGKRWSRTVYRNR